jgi:hypothetical protein
MANKNIFFVLLSLGFIIIFSGCTNFTTFQLSQPLNIKDNSLSSIWDKTIEKTGLDYKTVHLTQFKFRTDSTGNINSFQMLFSGIQKSEEMSYSASLQGVDTIILAKQDKSVFSDSGPNPDQVFDAIHSYTHSGNIGNYANISFTLENVANVMFDSKYFPIYVVDNGQLKAIKHIAFVENEVVFYLTLCNAPVPVLINIENNKFMGGSTKGVCETCERDCVILLDHDQLAKARIIEYS